MERIRLLQAKVEDGVVQIEQGGEFYPSDDTVIQGAGAGDSTGFVLVGDTFALYIVNTQPDLAAVIAKISESIDQVIQIANQLVVKVPSSPAVVLDAAAAAELEVIKTELNEIKLV